MESKLGGPFPPEVLRQKEGPTTQIWKSIMAKSLQEPARELDSSTSRPFAVGFHQPERQSCQRKMEGVAFFFENTLFICSFVCMGVFVCVCMHAFVCVCVCAWTHTQSDCWVHWS